MMERTSKQFGVIVLLALMALGTSCRKVVDWDLEGADPALVIESEISNQNEPWVVNLTLSRNYFDNSEIPPVETARVVISDDQGNADTLQHTGAGVYQSDGARACIPGRDYTLTVDYANRIYTATEKCREQEPIDTFTYFYQPVRNGFIDIGYYVFILAQEIDNPGDYYEWEIYKNDTLQDGFGYILDTDEFADFSFFNQNIDLDNISLEFLPRPFPFSFEEGDEVRVKQKCISKNYYEYLLELGIQYGRQGSPFDAPPANPIGNVSDAYGYFAVKNVEVRELEIKEQ